MKQHVITVLAVVLLIGAGLAYWLIKNQPETHLIAVIYDSSDEAIPRPNAGELIGHMEDISVYDGIDLHLYQLNDRLLSDEYELSFPKAMPLLSNEVAQGSKRKALFKEIDSLFASSISDTNYSNESWLYEGLVNVLNSIPNNDYGHYSIILYSDLGQNSPLYSYLNAADLALLQNSPDTLVKRFTDYQPLPDLTGVHIQVIYSTSSKSLENRFLLHYDLFRQLFEQAGATIEYSTTIKPLNHEE